jgi:hypothetical protein
MIRYSSGYSSFNEVLSNEKEYKNYKYWVIKYLNEDNEYHRLDGPAIEYSDGEKEYWYNDKFINVKTDKEFKQYLKMKVFL